jgi:hypothetical protein
MTRSSRFRRITLRAGFIALLFSLDHLVGER